MDVSILIRTKNEGAFLGETLKQVWRQDFKGEYEVVVVDSGSKDDTIEIAERSRAKVFTIPQSEFSYGRALNLGVREAVGEIIVSLSAHAVPRDDLWLFNLMRGFSAPDVAGVYGKQISIGKLNPFEALKNERFFGEDEIIFNLRHDEKRDRPHFSNANSAVRRDVLERFQFNEEVAWAEDILWQEEVLAAGFSIVYRPEAAVYHSHPVDLFKAYRSSKDCAYTLALMQRKKKVLPLVLYDAGIMLGSVPISVVENLLYLWRRGYWRYLKTAPLYIVSAWLGWLSGRIGYRLGE